jgi:hypothetical protein
MTSREVVRFEEAELKLEPSLHRVDHRLYDRLRVDTAEAHRDQLTDPDASVREVGRDPEPHRDKVKENENPDERYDADDEDIIHK